MPTDRKNLSIRTKIILIVLIGIIVVGAAIYAVSTRVLIQSYLAIEHDDVVQNIKRANDAITNRITELDVKLRDWSSWDQSYAYAKSHDPQFEELELHDLVLFNLEINAIIYFDLNGKPFFEKVVDLERKERIPGETITSAIITQTDIIARANAGSSTAGIISLPEGSLLVVAQPILTSFNEGPVAGTMVFARFLDTQAIEHLRQLTHISIKIFPYNAPALPEDVGAAREALSRENIYAVQPISNGSVGGYTVLYDLNNRPAFILSIDTPRNVYNQGQATIRTFVAIGGFATVAIGAILLFLLEYFVTSRFARLSKEVAAIGVAHDIAARVTEGAKDEVGQLADTINTMLTELSIAQKKEWESHEAEQAAGEKLKERMKEIERLNGFMINRELKMAELKEENVKLRKRLGEPGPIAARDEKTPI